MFIKKQTDEATDNLQTNKHYELKMNIISDEQQNRPSLHAGGDVMKYDFYVTENLTHQHSDLNFFQSRAPMEHSFTMYYP